MSTSKDKVLSFSPKEVVLCSQPTSRRLAGHLQNGAISGLSAGLYCGLSRSCVARTNPCCWAHVYLYLGHFITGSFGQWQDWLGKEADCPQNWSPYLLDYWTPHWNTHWLTFTWDKSIFKPFTHLERSIHILLPQMSFLLVYQSASPFLYWH